MIRLTTAMRLAAMLLAVASSGLAFAGGLDDAMAAAAAQKRGDSRAAVELYGKAIEAGDLSVENRARAYANRGLAYRDLRRLDEALADFDRSIALDPKFADAYNDRGMTFRALGQFDKALASYDIAIRLKRDFADAYSNRGNVDADKGELDHAIADYGTAIRLAPGLFQAYYNRGNVYANRKEYKKAIEDYTAAINIRPDFAEAYYNRGHAFMRIGSYSQAIADYDSVLRLRPDDADARENRELVRRLAQQLTAARGGGAQGVFPAASAAPELPEQGAVRPDISSLRRDAPSADLAGE